MDAARFKNNHMTTLLRWRGHIISLMGLLIILIFGSGYAEISHSYRVIAMIAGGLLIIFGFLDFLGLTKKVHQAHMADDKKYRDKHKVKQPWDKQDDKK